MPITVRFARPEEAAALSALCKRSKAYWGYDAGFMALSEPSLTIPPALIAAGRVLAAERGDEIVGMASLEPLEAGVFDLLHLFVEPGAIESGVGSTLFEAICELARRLDGKRLSITADPYAEAFYKQMGAKRVGQAPSDSVPDRMLPVLEYDL